MVICPQYTPFPRRAGKSESRRESVKVTREGGALVLVNRLGVDIRSLQLADEKGQIHTADDIAAGARVVLKPTKGKAQ